MYTVVPGDNLWTFSEKYLDTVLRFDQLRRMNNIQRPKRMQPGTRIRVPMDWIESNAVPAAIKALTGAATLLRASGESLPATAGQQVFLGDRIRTGNAGSVAVRFADDTVLTIYPDSEIRFDHLSAHGETGMVDSRMNLLRGRIDTRVTPASGPGSRFEIHTPSAISAVRGTEYRAAVEAETLTSSVEVTGGIVGVSGAATRESQQTLSAGFGTRVARGGRPQTPRELLPAPLLAALPVPVVTAGRRVTWSRVAGAERYRLELSSSPEFDTLLWAMLADKEQAPLPDLPDGQYHLRVRGIDASDLEGRDSVQRLELDAHPLAPTAVTPADGALLRGEGVTLEWSESPEASAYRLEIARDAAFIDLVVSKSGVSGSRFNVAKLPGHGDYFWRLSSLKRDGNSGPASAVRRFSNRPRLVAVTPTLQAMADNSVLASWEPTEPGLSYQVQLARDAGFRFVVSDDVVAETRFEFSPPPRRARYLRVRSVDATGVTGEAGDAGEKGPWGETQHIAAREADYAVLFPFFFLMGLLVL